MNYDLKLGREQEREVNQINKIVGVGEKMVEL